MTFNANEKGLTEDMYISAAKALSCEVAAIKAIVMTETEITGPFDNKGRPSILYERHYFSRLTKGKYDVSHPEVSGPRYVKYGRISEQYTKLYKAMELDKEAAWRSASWGAFQIMGDNYPTAGFSSIGGFVEGMNTISGQLYAFVNHVKNIPALNNAIINKNWSRFARLYNGPAYKEKGYDVTMSNNYDRALHR